MPGIALAQCAMERGHSILFVTAGRPVEERILAGFSRRALPLEAKGGGAPSLPAMALRMPRAIAAARAILREFNPNVVLGLGGLASFPAAVAARSMGKPVAVLEINAIPGRATRFLAPFAQKIFVSSDHALQIYKNRAMVTGMPLRPGFLQLPGRAEACTKFGLNPSKYVILVLGGSQGATAVNRVVEAILPEIESLGAQLLWIAGPGAAENAGAVCRARPALRAVVHGFVDDTPPLYAAADLAICRSGAATVAELATSGLPSIAIPYPYHRDLQQLRNAGLLGEGCVIMEERELTPARLSSELRRILTNPQVRASMSVAARRIAKPRASVDIVNELERMAGAAG